jgi:hypothetical protein
MPDTRPTITLKLKPYLQEFVLADLRDSRLASCDHLIGKLIRPFIQKRPKHLPPFMPEGPEFITLELPLYNDFDLRCGYYINARDQMIIQNILIVHFKGLFYQYMKDKVRFDQQNFQQCVYQFCFDYGFSFNHINYDMLKKTFYRTRKKDPGFKVFTEKLSHDLSHECPTNGTANNPSKFPFVINKK